MNFILDEINKRGKILYMCMFIYICLFFVRKYIYRYILFLIKVKEIYNVILYLLCNFILFRICLKCLECI